LNIVEQLSTDATIIATIMKDGNITEVEAEQLKMRVGVLADEISELL
jgi:hypothetical protein